MTETQPDLNIRVSRVEQSIEHISKAVEDISQAIVKLADVQTKFVEIETHTNVMRERVKNVEMDAKEIRSEVNDVKTSAIVNKVKIGAIVAAVTLIGSAFVTAFAKFVIYS